jgi:hypothetical protein
MATTTPNFGWSVPTSSDLVKNGAVAIETLGDSIDASLVDLKGGTTGQVLAKASNTDMDFVWAADAGAPTSLGYAAGKNKIINGDFGIWQRGTSFTPSTSYTYNADRWAQVFDVAPTTGSITRETFTPGTAPVAGYEGQYFHRTTITTRGSSTYYILGQRIEDVRTFAGQTITVSFWAKLNAGSVSTSRIRVSQDFGSGGSGTVTTDNSYNFTPTGSWTRFSLTIPVPSISGKTIGTGNNLIVDAVVPYSAANTVDFWGWQVEAGSVATAFQTATGTIQGELAACQRYYQRFTGGSSYSFYAYGNAVSTTLAYYLVNLKQTMRVKPTAIEYSNLATQDLANPNIALSSLVIDNTANGPDFVLLQGNVASGLTQYRSYSLNNNNNAAGYVALSAEL